MSHTESGTGAGAAADRIEPWLIEPWLREILCCPACRHELRDGVGPDGAAELVCTAADCGLAYRVDDGIPVLLVDEARAPQG